MEPGFVFLSTLSLRRATRPGCGRGVPLPISIHALLAESDPSSCAESSTITAFLSTLSLRRATLLAADEVHHVEISIHALLAESDHVLFNIFRWFAISIHALLAESDKSLLTSVVSSADFYPRSPCGERRGASSRTPRPCTFLSTLSLRRATHFFQLGV